MQLYKLTNQYQELYDLLSTADETEADGLHEILAQNADAFEDEVENIAKIIATMKGESEAIKTEEERLRQRRQTLENRTDSLKRYLYDNMNVLGLDKVKGELFTVAIQKSPPSLDIPDESVIPAEYFIPVDPKLDRKRLLEDIKAGAVIEGAEIKQGTHLRIR